MAPVLQALFVLCLLALAVPVCVLALQVIAAPRAVRPRDLPAGPRPKVALLVPAHNEAAGIGATLASIRAQLGAGDRLLVVADNCSDDTAVAAHIGGAEVAIRADPIRRGKGYALAFGMRELGLAPPQVVIVVDADCLLAPGAIDWLAHACAASGRPVQAAYLMHARDGAGPEKKVAQFAWTVKNWLRPLGGRRLGLGCQLAGSGMALPWQLARTAPLASAHLVEDLKLGLDLALAGHAPVFCAQAVVTSVFADSAAGGRIQRTRWEHGHLGLIARYGPRLVMQALARRDAALFALALDLCVPPVSLLLMLATLLGACGALAWAISGNSLPWAPAAALPLMLAAALALAWLKAGRAILPAHQLGHAARYALAKIPLYLRFVVRRQAAWIASARDKP